MINIKTIMQDRNLHTTSKAIYSYMGSFKDNSQCYFHICPKMVYDLQINDKTLRKYLKQLIKNGYVKTTKQLNKKGRYQNIYEILNSK